MEIYSHIENIKEAKRARLRELAKRDNKSYSPFPSGATSSFKEDTAPIGSNPFMEF